MISTAASDRRTSAAEHRRNDHEDEHRWLCLGLRAINLTLHHRSRAGEIAVVHAREVAPKF